MDFFLDTSVLFKLFIQEDHSDDYLSLLQEDPVIHVSHISWVEFHSALCRRVRLKEVSIRQRNDILSRFKKDWKSYVKVRVSEAVLESAADLISAYSLKTLDSIQLASALEIKPYITEPWMFLTADVPLQSAARKEHLKTGL